MQPKTYTSLRELHQALVREPHSQASFRIIGIEMANEQHRISALMLQENGLVDVFYRIDWLDVVKDLHSSQLMVSRANLLRVNQPFAN